jgi:hypothetical protein
MTKSLSNVPLRAVLVALGVAAGLASSREAAADESEGEGADEVTHIVSPGLMFSLSLGDKTAFGLGLDARYTAVFGRAAGVGAFAQATWLNFSAGRFAAGAHGGGWPGIPAPISLDGELGWTYRTAFDEATANSARERLQNPGAEISAAARAQKPSKEMDGRHQPLLPLPRLARLEQPHEGVRHRVRR